ncbi:hypothetical protein D0Z07_8512 [Hyphodiscus hymeniophilus]|uniref:Actin-like ATPase domain-containing protein n=1 Tax=Hyphodiscus hymeniophilus TaxID=353542 RepID=A0A9P6SKK7_9HELO|nr:hypothetical protein D0Z07_8512 [Hyphodiscus hymeniophilus]
MPPSDLSLQDDLLSGFEHLSVSPAQQRAESRSTIKGGDPPISYPPPPMGEVPLVQTRWSSPFKSRNDTKSIPRPTGTSALNRLVIAVDYGTTFTGIAFATPTSPHAILKEIKVLEDWPAEMGNSGKIPSVISYSPSTDAGELQWGASISPNAVTMFNTKLELDVQDNKIDELDLVLAVLDGVDNLNFETVKASASDPEYTPKTPEQVVTDYLTHLFEHLSHEFDHFGSRLREQLQVDVVVSVPVGWSYRATNSTLRAIASAGLDESSYPSLRNVMVVTEPEAAALFTARSLKEDKNTDFLRPNDCFILCDAGGGTVVSSLCFPWLDSLMINDTQDVVTYRVVSVVPTLELKAVTIATSAKCGAIFIDRKFKKWLKFHLGKHYLVLDPDFHRRRGGRITESGDMREIMRTFDEWKKSFSRQSDDIKFYVPEGPLWEVSMRGKLQEGELTIPREDMMKFFNQSVNGVVELISAQRTQAEHKNHRSVFLVGGFGASPYLQEELEKSLKYRQIALHRPESALAWTAVVRGAVMYGIEKGHHETRKTPWKLKASYGIMLTQPFSFNSHLNDRRWEDMTNMVMADRQLSWLVRRGDWVLPGSDSAIDDAFEERIEKHFVTYYSGSGEQKVSIPVYEYGHPDDIVPTRYDSARHGMSPIFFADVET